MEVIVKELLLGDSDVMRRLRATIARIAPASLPVLIEGPTGSGKELVARALHDASGRRGQFVAFNVCAIAETMFEDALFGHVRGAFTGATNDATGYLRQANEGTSFFDEVSGLSPGLQVKLLRAVETGEFRPVGGSKDVKSQFRLVAATNQPLDQLAETGAFREDLLHRFGKMIIRIPPLRHRREDVGVLVEHFLSAFSPRGRHSFSAAALEAVSDYDWPGNVRELRSVVETVVALAVDDRIDAIDVARVLENDCSRRVSPFLDWELKKTVETLLDVQGDTELAAERLGVHRSTIYRRVHRAQAEGLYRI